MFFDDELVELIVRESNTYYSTKNTSHKFHSIAFHDAGLETCD